MTYVGQFRVHTELYSGFKWVPPLVGNGIGLLGLVEIRTSWLRHPKRKKSIGQCWYIVWVMEFWILGQILKHQIVGWMALECRGIIDLNALSSFFFWFLISVQVIVMALFVFIWCCSFPGTMLVSNLSLLHCWTQRWFCILYLDLLNSSLSLSLSPSLSNHLTDLCNFCVVTVLYL